MNGERVRVEYREQVGADSLNSPIYEYTYEEIDNVMIAPGPRSDIQDSTRPEGVLVRYTLYFPKTFSRDLEGLRVSVRGEWLDVIGHPDFYTDSVTPTKWHLVVEVKTSHG